MKKILFLFITVVIFVSCQDENFGYTTQDIKMAAYKENFVKTFGTPDPSHNWGFKCMEIIDHTSSSDTRSASPNANQWGDWGLDVPYPLTQVQKDFVTNWFATTKAPIGIAVSWTDYFAQQVSSTNYGRHMDKILDAGPNGDDHIFNYNNGDGSSNGSVTSPIVNGQYTDKIQYMTGQSTEHFAYHETLSDKDWYNHYVIISGEMIDPTNSLSNQTTVLTDLNGNVLNDKNGKPITITQSIWGMWFVAFDYEAQGQSQNQIVERDYYYNDWIIKISPGTYSLKAERVMCEDLGNSFDWDFNDVVFDVNFTSEWKWNGYITEKVTTAHLTIQCAGGTMPIKVGTTDDNKEIHKLFNTNLDTPIIHPQAPVQYTVTVNSQWWLLSLLNGVRYEPDASMIPIYVDGNELSTIAQKLQNSGVPQKFSCPTSVMWQEELTNIVEKYPKFTQWVQDCNATGIWEYNPQK